MSDNYSFVVVYLFNMDIYLYISMYIQAEYRRFGVFIFCCIISCTCYIFFIVACCFITVAGGRGVFIYFRQTACISFIFTAFIVFSLLSSYHSLHRLSPPTHSRFYKGGFIPCFISIFLFVTLLPFFPLVTSLTWLRYDVLEPQP